MSNFQRRVISGALVLLLLLAGLYPPARLPGSGARVLAASTPSPDLVIESLILSPEAPSIGDTLTFTVTIKNRGDSQAGPSQVAFTIDEHSLATIPVDSLAPGAVTVKVFTWKAQAGPHIFRAVIDYGSSIAESDEDNNDKTYAFSVLAPDLIIDAISWTPENPSIGDKVIFTVKIVNQGDKRAGISYVDFSIDGNSRGHYSLLGIEAGASVNVTFSWTAIPGFHNVRAAADVLHQVTESDEANNASEATYATATPDLVVDSLTWSQDNPATGANVTLTARTSNHGSGKAGPSSVTYYIDNTPQDSVFVGSLNPGAAVTTTFWWIAENSPHTFKVSVDAGDLVKESDETNNTRAISSPLILPDLIIQDITWSPSNPLVQGLVSFTVTVKNQGKCEAGSAELKFSINSVYMFNGIIGGLPAGATTTAIFNWTTPPNFSHTVKAVIDEKNIIKESNESNNTMTKTVTSSKLVPTADLTLEKITCSPAEPALGETLTITLDIQNRGTGKATPSYAAIYIENSLMDEVYINELDAGATLTKDIKLPLQGLPFKDSYKVRAVLDSHDSVFETNEANNEKETSFRIFAPDLVVQVIRWSPEVPAAGDMITFDVTVKNRGDLKSGSTYISYYVDKAFMGQHRIEDIEPGTTVTRSFTWAASKVAFVFTAVIDEANQITESDEPNNTRTAVLPAPDLTIDSITSSPENPTENTTVTFTASVRNRGYGQVSGTLLSGYVDGTTPLSLDTGEISPGGTATVVFTQIFLPGEHTIRLMADGNDAIAESDESNNEKTINFSVQPHPGSVLPPAPESANNTSVKPPAPASSGNASTDKALPLSDMTPAPIPVNDITANITAPPPKWQGILQNRWFIIGTGGLGVAAIGLLLFFRKKTKKS